LTDGRQRDKYELLFPMTAEDNVIERAFPPRFQPPYSNWCGPACAQMILEHHCGRKIPLRRLAREMRARCGVDLFEYGTWFLRRGFDVQIVGWWDDFPTKFIDLRARDVAEALQKWIRGRCRRGSDRSYFRRRLTAFLKAGGRFIPRPVRPEDLRAALRRGQPPVLALDCAPLHCSGRKTFEPHYVVVTGLSPKAAAINDPYPGDGGRRIYPLDRFLHACYRDQSAAVFIRPKGRTRRHR